MTTEEVQGFDQLGLAQPLLQVLNEIGYETPSPIQARTIPLVLQGRDLIGQAQTGTGKTAAFALPLLSNIEVNKPGPQVLVLAPTRELAIQVAEAFQKYARHVKGVRVLAIYGGQAYTGQIQALKRGVQVVVGTPGRVMDHMRKGTLKLNNLKTLVLDEADEMLRMGFIDDVEWVLEQSPDKRQVALFSATMPDQIRRIANRHLNNPEHVHIEVKTTTADTIRQRYWLVRGAKKLDALTRILEAEEFNAILIFVRTKLSTVDLSEKLSARGFSCAPLNGDIAQAQRERTVRSLKSGGLDVIVATDVAARGLDVTRISHVINYDIPTDTESYVHRIGRTGRAGREGDAISFVAPREKRLLFAIERATRQKIEQMELPTTKDINDQRIIKFEQRITDTLSHADLGIFPQLIEDYIEKHDVTVKKIAAALAYLSQGEVPLLLDNKPAKLQKHSAKDSQPSKRSAKSNDRKPSKTSSNESRASKPSSKKPGRQGNTSGPERGMLRYRVEVGSDDGAEVGNIVGAIANEAEIESRYIGKVELAADHALVDMPEGMPKEVFRKLGKTWVAGKQLKISYLNSEDKPEPSKKKAKPSSRKKPSGGKKKREKKKTSHKE